MGFVGVQGGQKKKKTQIRMFNPYLSTHSSEEKIHDPTRVNFFPFSGPRRVEKIRSNDYIWEHHKSVSTKYGASYSPLLCFITFPLQF